MKTVLFAWELGTGMGHVAGLRRYAARLRRHDVRLVAAVRNPDAAQSLTESGVDIIQAPPWPEASFTLEQYKVTSSVTIGDSLAAAGLADEPALTGLLRTWDSILTRVRPDLVVADFSPAAALVARGRIPLFLVGNGFTLPPAEMTHFPFLHRLSSPVWDETRIVTVVNKAARSVGAQALDRLPQLFSADAHLVETLPLLDPYDLQRVEPVDGAAFDRVPAARQPDATSIVAYLARGYAVQPNLIDVLRSFSNRLHIHAPELSSAQHADLAAADVHERPMVLGDVLPAARLVVHLGGSGLAAQAIVAGVPQLVIARQVEQELNGAALTRAGIGQMIRGYDPAANISQEIISGILNDDTLAQRARDAGEHYRAISQHLDPLAKFERIAMTLLGAQA